MNCPSCGSIDIRPSEYKDGDYCGKCGLVIRTYYPDRIFKKKKKSPPQPKKKKSLKCLTCPSTTNLTRHHIIPKRTKMKTKTVILCRFCHNIADLLANTIYPMDIELVEIAEGDQK